eukprot:s503_g8.t1
MLKYDAANEVDEVKTLKFLEGRIAHYINKQMENRNVAKWDKYSASLTSTKPGAPAPADDGDTASPSRRRKKKDGGDTPAGSSQANATPIIANPPPKQHDKKKPDKTRNRSVANKIPNSEKPCYFHVKKKDCSKGSACELGHLEFVHEAWKKKQKERKDPSRGRRPSSGSSRRRSSSGGSADKEKKPEKNGRSPSPGKRSGRCVLWTQFGSCKHGTKCKYKHDDAMKGSKKKTDKKATPALTSISDSEDEGYTSCALPEDDPVDDPGALSDWDLGMDPDEIFVEFNMPMSHDVEDKDPSPDEPEMDPEDEEIDGGRCRVRRVEEQKEDDDLDAPDDDGNPELRRRGTLKAEARELKHLLTYRYKNPYCDACVRAKMKYYKSYRGAFKRKLKKFGDLITFDFVDTSRVHDKGLLLENEVLIVRDRYTGLIGAYPSQKKASEDVVRAIKRFTGRFHTREAYMVTKHRNLRK